MKTLRKRIQYISAFLLLNFLVDIFFPAVSYALTAGPTAPEFTSFEPVDTSQMVDTKTGDFNYSLPLMEVAGTSGSYPISLFYHGGITPDEEASWVGLGWNINVGSISRYVRGIPDDQLNAHYTVRDQWNGGETINYSFGIPIKKVNLTVAGSYDTYRGHKLESMGLYGEIAGFGTVGLRGESGSDGGSYLDVKTNGLLSIGTSVNLQTGKVSKPTFSTSTYGGTSVSYSDGNLGISIFNGAVSSSTQGGTRFGGFKTNIGHSNKTDEISTDVETDFSLGDYSFHHVRYWQDETDNAFHVGSLNHHETLSTGSGDGPAENVMKVKSFDRHLLYSPSFNYYGYPGDEEPIISQKTAKEVETGPSIAAYDVYSVASQGIGGVMTPYNLENPTLYDKLREDLHWEAGDYQVIYDVENVFHHKSTHKAHFRFKGQLSNELSVSDVLGYEISDDPEEVEFFLGENELGYTPSFIDDQFDKSDDNQMYFGKHIRYYTNSEIDNQSSNSELVNYPFKKTDYSEFEEYAVGDQVGGFSITKEDGMTYHYFLPVYTYGEESIHFHEQGESQRKRTMTNHQPYATNWLLTAVTGPDYVDANHDNIVDPGDWGYWIGFKYGRFLDNYKFRSPSEEGYHEDLDGSIYYSYGSKEVYYLDAIYSDRQTALFGKSLKYDSKSVVSFSKGDFGITEYGVSSPKMKLDRLRLYQNSDLYSSDDVVSELESIAQGTVSTAGFSDFDIFFDQVISTEEMENLSADYLSETVLGYDYTLCPQTPNSLRMAYGTGAIKFDEEYGKLTLKSVQNNGINGESLVPPTTFDYDLHSPSSGTGEMLGLPSSTKDIMNILSGEVERGDIVNINNSEAYAVVTSAGTLNGSDYCFLSFLTEDHPNGQVDWVVTKNPPYSADKYDNWGSYKSDYKEMSISEYVNNSLARRASELSSKNIDVWSLRSIGLPMGGELRVEYEPDTYVNEQNTQILNFHQEMEMHYTHEDGSGDTFTRTGQNCNFRTYDYEPNNELRYGTLDWIKLSFRESNVSELLEKSFQEDGWIKIRALTSILGVEYSEHGYLAQGYLKIIEVGDDYVKCSDPNKLLTNEIHNGHSAYAFRFFAGYAVIESVENYGGGIRVSSISTYDEDEKRTALQYSYSDGRVIGEPSGMNDLFVPTLEFMQENNWEETVLYFSNWNKYLATYQHENHEKFKSSELFSTGSPVYGQVQINTSFKWNDTPGSELWKFNVDVNSPIEFETGEGGDFISDYHGIPTLNGHTSKNHLIIDKSSEFGNISSHRILDEDDQIIHSTDYEYTDSDLQEYNDLGSFEEVWNEHRKVTVTQIGYGEWTDFDETWNFATTTTLREVPSILKKVTSKNHKTGLTSSTEYLAFDSYSGQIVETVSTDGKGTAFVEKKVPAYRINEYQDMGPILDGGKNMLTQTAQNSTFMVDVNNYDQVIGLVSSNIQTWNDEWGYFDGLYVSSDADAYPTWRRHRSYNYAGAAEDTLNPNGTIQLADLNENVPYFGSWEATPDEMNEPADDSGWEKASEITLYDRLSHALEVIDVNDNYAATKMNKDNSLVMATASNASYKEFAFCGAENLTSSSSNLYFSNEIFSEGELVDDASHTGDYCIGSNSGSIAFSYTLKSNEDLSHPDRKFRVSVWSNSDTGAILNFEGESFSPHSISPNVNGWYLHEWIVTPVLLNSDVEVISNTYAYYDDFRIHPVNSSMISYVYNEHDQLTYVLNPNNIYTKYEHDAMGRLERVYQESIEYGKVAKISEQEINHSK